MDWPFVDRKPIDDPNKIGQSVPCPSADRPPDRAGTGTGSRTTSVVEDSPSTTGWRSVSGTEWASD